MHGSLVCGLLHYRALHAAHISSGKQNGDADFRTIPSGIFFVCLLKLKALTMVGFAMVCQFVHGRILFIILCCLLRALHGTFQAMVQVTIYTVIATAFPTQIARVVGFIEVSWGKAEAFI